ncbi:MOSC N-terminal beta barrel domain-containing protein [Chamaesiphon sp. OTE_75_metabat_556]|uniref:MOSC domain-containing protein n=1 Tax=Chamaesiphon sp. OTE_75_metabat_556 TaxID=2964692 RepID=UPI00286AC539|nr:MOSC N-terminal beta barrel domain-containing protein [Chamaesiphon sp. OTE_75_metabat_556]
MTANSKATLTQIVIYPVKSLDGMVVDRSQISAGGALAFDRRWAIVDAVGKVVNAKRTAKIQQLRSRFDLINTGSESDCRSIIQLQTVDDVSTYTFCLITELTELSRWLSQFFGFAVSIIENPTTGFPDDLNAYSPTIVSTATLEAICEWFTDLDLAEVRRRFRTNLELSGVPAFWEDRLFGAPDEVVDFQLGNVQFYGINPCQRCIVPTRNSLSGAVTPKFQQIFTQQRQQTLPPEINIARFNHFYRLAVNTQIPLVEAGKFLNTGDRLMLSSVDDR